MDVTDWLSRWLARHPLRAPAEEHMSRYTEDVMRRVKALPQPLPSPRLIARWLAWPRFGLAAACAVVLVFLVGLTLRVSAVHLARATMQEAEVLEQLSDGIEEPLGVGDTEALTKELELHDAMVLAEAQPTDEQWIEQNLRILDQLDEPAAQEPTPDAGTGSGAPEDDLLNDLQWLDNTELSPVQS